ncbi:hypothetical protein BMETH_32511642048, partial [methanotrophic bacterial endosymbiont of Bathymodiolus sp.]
YFDRFAALVYTATVEFSVGYISYSDYYTSSVYLYGINHRIPEHGARRSLINQY